MFDEAKERKDFVRVRAMGFDGVQKPVGAC